MAKPRVIIADSDLGYIFPLQLKFAEDFFEKIDLEIITDQAYFQQLLSTPQHADILIVSEKLYDRSIQRHNIANIFLMTEQFSEDQETDPRLHYIFKYTSIKEIFNEIIGNSADALKGSAAKSQQTQVVLVCSASGGTGKTTVAMGMAASLSRNYKRVLYLNADRLHTFQYLLESQAPIAAPEVYAKLAAPGEDIYSQIKHVIRKELFSYLPPFKAALMSLGLSYSVYEKIIASAKQSGDFDFILVDADVAFDEEKAQLMNMADRVVVVTNQRKASVTAANILASNVNGMGGEKYIFLCNDFEKDADNSLVAPGMGLKFTVSEYIEHFDSPQQLSPEGLSKESSIQRAAFLIM